MANQFTRRWAAALVLASALGAGGAAQAASQKVTISNFAFAPASVTLKAGESVTWTNEDGVPHSLDGGGAFHSAVLSKGQSFTFVFAKAGSFAYRCGIHSSMTGTVVVQ